LRGRTAAASLIGGRLPAALTFDGVLAITIAPHLRLTLRGENLLDAKVVSGISSVGIEDRGTPRTLWLGLVCGR